MKPQVENTPPEKLVHSYFQISRQKLIQKKTRPRSLSFPSDKTRNSETGNSFLEPANAAARSLPKGLIPTYRCDISTTSTLVIAGNQTFVIDALIFVDCCFNVDLLLCSSALSSLSHTFRTLLSGFLWVYG